MIGQIDEAKPQHPPHPQARPTPGAGFPTRSAPMPKLIAFSLHRVIEVGAEALVGPRYR